MVFSYGWISSVQLYTILLDHDRSRVAQTLTLTVAQSAQMMRALFECGVYNCNAICGVDARFMHTLASCIRATNQSVDKDQLGKQSTNQQMHANKPQNRTCGINAKAPRSLRIKLTTFKPYDNEASILLSCALSYFTYFPFPLSTS